MRTILSASILLVIATTASGQFGRNQDKPAGQPPAGQANNVDPAGADPNAAAAPAPNAMFSAIDADGDGVITKVELRKAIAALRQLDSDNDGNITLAEVTGAPILPGGNPAVDQMLAQYDKNADGKLTVDEVPQELLPQLQNADVNGDKSIDRAELTAAMQNAPNQFQNAQGGAATGPSNRVNEEMTGRFISLYDSNNDGMLSSKELPPRVRQSFQATDDIDRDGSISPAELQAVMARQPGNGRAWMGGANPTGQQNTFRDPNRRRPPQPQN